MLPPILHNLQSLYTLSHSAVSCQHLQFHTGSNCTTYVLAVVHLKTGTGLPAPGQGHQAPWIWKAPVDKQCSCKFAFYHLCTNSEVCITQSKMFYNRKTVMCRTDDELAGQQTNSPRTKSPPQNQRVSADKFPDGRIAPTQNPGPGICPGGICLLRH